MGRTLKRHDMMLAAMSTAGCAPFQPVHVQKLFFLIDRKLADTAGGTYFDFEPYDYGPFDKNVYANLDELSDAGLVQITGDGRYRSYSLTEAGRERGVAALSKLTDKQAAALRTLTTFVRSLGFAALVTTIYSAFPEMKVNSVFSPR